MIENKIQRNIPLAPLTTFKIGGPAKLYVEIEKKEDLIDIINWARENHELYYFLGAGSNILVKDEGVDGLVIRLKNKEAKIRGERLDCGAGCLLSQALILAIGNNLSGLEWAIGIPGTIGGCIRGNAGAYGFGIADILETAEVFNIIKNEFEPMSRNDCGFSYRESIFKDNKNLIIWSATLKLESHAAAEIKKLTNKYFKDRGNKQPKLPSAGSIFKNIAIDKLKAANNNLAELAIKTGVAKNGLVPAGWIIDMLGVKGKKIGGAKVSLEHANFIVNTGKATADDVFTLISYIKQQARDKFGIQLYEEVQYFGF